MCSPQLYDRSEEKSNKNQYSIEDNYEEDEEEGTGVVDIDLEESETF